MEASGTVFDTVAKEKISVAEAFTPEHKHDIISDKGSRVEVFCSVLWSHQSFCAVMHE